MERWFQVDHLDVERLLKEWRWPCPKSMTLVAKSSFADLFLRDAAGRIFHLDVTIGRFTEIANSELDFRKLVETAEKRKEWFAETEEAATVAQGLRPDATQCIGFSVPLVFAESGSGNKPYIVDLYEHVSFLGDLNRQISTCPDGTKVRLHKKANPSS